MFWGWVVRVKDFEVFIPIHRLSPAFQMLCDILFLFCHNVSGCARQVSDLHVHVVKEGKEARKKLQEYIFSGIDLMVGIVFHVLGVVFKFANIQFLLDRFHECHVRLFRYP